MKVLISTTTFADFDSAPLDLLKKNRIEWLLNPYKRKLSEQEISQLLGQDSFVGIIAGTESLTKNVLNGARSLKIISRVGIGLDNVDLNAARERNIKVYTTPDVLTDSVAELTLGLMLSCLRKIPCMDRNIRRLVWKKEMGWLLKDKTLGVIGFGKIGKRVAQLVKCFGAKIMYFDTKPQTCSFASPVSFNKLLSTSDIISLHADSKNPLITERELARIKSGVILINTSRGSLVKESALLQGLRTGKVASAGLDVFEQEPYSGELIQCDSVVLTPHVGSYAREARIEMELQAVKNLLKGLQCKK